MKKINKIIFKPADDSVYNKVGYVYLPDFPNTHQNGVVKKSIELFDLIGKYEGASVIFDFDENNTLIGIEILG